MKQRISLVSSIVQTRCPRCREGKIFPYSVYSSKFMVTNDRCPECGLSFNPELGFFLGAAFFSYFINAVLLSGIALILYYMEKEITFLLAAIIVLIVVFGLLPVTLRLSKSIWIHLLIKYEGR